ncbi:MAG: RluA family pseudouridine synthase [Clostridia bacterium]|nr:RluA family pseudouridine synthase [Clostridia bacterium]MBR6701661.1 RluA family pseudouridine synthase [Clostridia bacterium]
MPRIIDFEITDEYENIKIFTYLKYKKGFSTKLIRTLKNTGNGILLNGKFARTVDLLKAGDRLTVTIPDDESAPEPAESEIDIIYEDDDVLVVNKSPYMAMHPTHNHQGDTLANAVASHLAKEGKSCAFRAVGRLDKGTSGLVVCALNPLAASKLNGRIKKEYTAVVKGVPGNSGTVDVPIYRPDPMKTLRACSYEKGVESAVTHWELIEAREDRALIRLNLETGRTHQIRVHMAHVGHPLAGDSYYGDFLPEYGHQLLHCGKIEFTHPVTGEDTGFTAPPPPEFEKCMKE